MNPLLARGKDDPTCSVRWSIANPWYASAVTADEEVEALGSATSSIGEVLKKE